MNDCVFCKIIREEIPSAKIYEDADVLAFLDIKPVNPGHTLLIPKAHFEKMTGTPDKVVGDLFITAKKLMGALKNVTAADYVALSVIGIDVPHFHIHLIPRYFNDGLASFWPTKKYKEGEIFEMAKKIKQSL